jgi:hypothetical protein
VVKAVMKSAFDIKVKRQYRQPEKKGFHIAVRQRQITEMDDRVQTNISNNGLGSCTAQSLLVARTNAPLRMHVGREVSLSGNKRSLFCIECQAFCAWLI